MAPVLFEERLSGESIRAYVAGGAVVAAATIHAEALDYRQSEQTVTLTALGPEESRAIREATTVCGMAFSGVDLIRLANGFRLLECNPSPLFAVFEDKTGADIAGPLADLLMA